MNGFGVEFIILTFIASVKMGTPLLFATMGGVVNERSGVVNLGIDGLMLVGALTAFVVKLNYDSTWLAVLAAALVSAAVALIHALVCISLRANQIASGLALGLFGVGLSGLFGAPYVGKSIVALPDIAVPVLSSIPLLGRVLFQQDGLVYFSFFCVALTWYLLFYTRTGLNLRSTGEAPEVSNSIGLSVTKYRYMAVWVGGLLIGVGGAYFPLVLTSFWVDNLTAGRGWIAVALVIFAFWHPGKALLGAYLFGAALALQLRLQLLGVKMSPYFLEMLPYVLTILVLTLATIRYNIKGVSQMPAALGLTFVKGEKH
ncbi:ABC transporter permease [bacterium]|nr:ABC transporter permease [bacterium]